MSSLKEIKGRIASVKSTLKITSAMKMVASAKLHKAQGEVERCSLYQRELSSIMDSLSACLSGKAVSVYGPRSAEDSAGKPGKVAVVVVSSNSSLCGGFNSNVIRLAKSTVADLHKDGVRNEDIEMHIVGKKAADALAKEGLRSVADYNELVARTAYTPTSDLAQSLMDGYQKGTYSKVLLVYNHFVSTASQKPTVETFLPIVESSSEDEPSEGKEVTVAPDDNFILEPDAETLYAELMPKVLRLKVYTVILDSVAAEHAARTVAMQTATDNGNNILSDLTLEYNKGRQQKITSEILDLVGGSLQ